jgi:flagellar biosynthesis protein
MAGKRSPRPERASIGKLDVSEERKSAVALRYAPSQGDSPPRVVATGQGLVAEEILRLAREHDIPLRQDAALACALASLDLGASIPPELFRAVAEVLAFVYKMNDALGKHTTPALR